MDAVVKRIVSEPPFVRPVEGLIKRHVDSSVEECRLSQICGASGGVGKGTPIPPADCPS